MLKGEDRDFGGNNLFVDLIPSSCWFTNARFCIHPDDWDYVRKMIYKRAGYKCECCGVKNVRLEAHERWDYNEDKKVQILRRIICLCHDCHETTHIGLAEIKGRYKEARYHLLKVRGFTDKECDSHIEEAYKLYYKRSKFNWELNLDILTNSGIKIIKPVNKNDRQNYIKF